MKARNPPHILQSGGVPGGLKSRVRIATQAISPAGLYLNNMLSQRTKMKHSYEVRTSFSSFIYVGRSSTAANGTQNALRLLQTRRRKARPTTPAQLDGLTPSATQSVRGVPSLVGMDEWLRALGHAVWISFLYPEVPLFVSQH